MEKQFRKIRYLLSGSIAVILFIVYFATLAPDVTFTDSGELASVCATLGVAHPSGYPLFTILGHLWTWLPLSANVVYELNIFAAFLTMLSAVALANAILSLLLLIRRKEPASFEGFDFKNPDFLTYFGIPLLTSLTYGFAQTVWNQAVAIEVYSLHLLIMNLALWALFTSFKRESPLAPLTSKGGNKALTQSNVNQLESPLIPLTSKVGNKALTQSNVNQLETPLAPLTSKVGKMAIAHSDVNQKESPLATLSSKVGKMALTPPESHLAPLTSKVGNKALAQSNTIEKISTRAQFAKGRNRGDRTLFLTAFLLGLGFSNHLTTMLLLPAFLFLFLKPPGERFSINKNKQKDFLMLIAFFAIGLSLYLYLPIRSACLPEMNWGWTHRDFDKFLYHIQGKQYQVWMFSGLETFFKGFTTFIKLVPAQLGWIGIISMFVGFWASYKLSKEIFWFLILFTFGSLIYSLNYSIHDIDSYFLQTFTGLIIFSALCLYYFRKHIKAIISIAVLIPVFNLVLNYTHIDRSDDFMVAEYSRIMMDNLEPNAIIISSQWDFWCSAFLYYQTVDKRRTDVALVELELLRRTWYPLHLQRTHPETVGSCKTYFDDYMQTLLLFESEEPYNPMEIQSRFINMINCIIDNNFPNRPVYLTVDVLQKEQEIAKNYRKIPHGFAFKLDKSDENPNISVDNIDISLLSQSISKNSGHLTEGIAETSSINLSLAGNYALSFGNIEVAKEAYKKALKLDPKNQMAKDGANRIKDLEDKK